VANYVDEVSTRKPVILIVDDEEEIRELCRVNLEFEGFEVVEAADGLEALAISQESRPDLIFLDLMMPRMDGWEVLRRLKEKDETASIPVVLLTAKTSEEDQIRGWEEGILEYISKPFNPLTLGDWASRFLTPRDHQAEEERRQRILDQLQLLRSLRRRRPDDE
jgi:DNA-binding response OmpR family regulator